MRREKRAQVIYICFGSMSNFTASQLRELAMGLEASGHQFIWVVRKGKDDEGWLPEGYEERVEGKGLIVRGWAPQVLVLDHGSTGAFMTHCGWNSTLEGICAGVPMVTWPLYAEQFFNEKLVCQVLEVGVGVGAKEWSRVTDGVKGEDVAEAVKRVMSGVESEELRGRARRLKEKALRAIEPGGSSISSLDSLLHDLTTYKPSPKRKPLTGYEEVLRKANQYAQTKAEETRTNDASDGKPTAKAKHGGKGNASAIKEKGVGSSNLMSPRDLTAITMHVAQIYEQIKKLDVLVPPTETGRTLGKGLDRFGRYHKAHCHDTDN
ncbi:unnamed protein product [Cuscuta campestris]|uniref:Uncharacterized protein n=1 Tax=Cuscuta campestris TaxID=132261 RepID=A0A484L8J3_9ASTE|nr:unnamed protein product [Cuscuta campestris]